jgi:hypothetical protein
MTNIIYDPLSITEDSDFIIDRNPDYSLLYRDNIENIPPFDNNIYNINNINIDLLNEYNNEIPMDIDIENINTLINHNHYYNNYLNEYHYEYHYETKEDYPNINILNSESLYNYTEQTEYTFNNINSNEFYNDNLDNTSISLRKHNIIVYYLHSSLFNINEIECCICMEDKQSNNNKNICKFNCNHEFCVECICNLLKKTLIEEKEISCPLCREKITDICTQKIENMELLNQYCIINNKFL